MGRKTGLHGQDETIKKLNETIIELNETINKSNETINKLNIKIHRKDELISKLKGENRYLNKCRFQLKLDNGILKRKLSGKFRQQINNNSCNNNGYNITIPPKFLEYFNVKMIQHFMPNLLRTVFFTPNIYSRDSFSHIVHKTRFNCAVPIFNGVYVPNKSRSYAEVSTGTRFEIIPLSIAIDYIYDAVLPVYIDGFEIYKHDLPCMAKKEAEIFIKYANGEHDENGLTAEENKKFFEKRTKEQIRALLLDSNGYNKSRKNDSAYLTLLNEQMSKLKSLKI